MDIEVLSMRMAETFFPKGPTMAIRIFSTPNFAKARKGELLYKARFAKILEYTFDDVGPIELADNHWMRYHRQNRGIVFNPRIAMQILKDFEENRHKAETLMIHCHSGISRSPAVALGLDKVFGLGQEKKLIRDYGWDYNPFVYNTMIEAGKTFGK